MQILDKAQFEVEFLKKELEKHLKHKEQLLLEKERGAFPSPMITADQIVTSDAKQETPQLEGLLKTP